MKLIIDINEKDYNSIISDKLISPRNLNVYERIIANGIPLEEELEKTREEIKIKGFDYNRDIYKEITDMICDINTREIKSHRTDEELDEWTDAWGHHMMQLLAELCTKDEYLNMFRKELKGENNE